MKTYFYVGDERFESREEAVERVGKWKADPTKFYVHEVASAQVTRNTRKGEILTELVRGSLDGIPRIVSVRELSPTYVVLYTDTKPMRYWSHDTYFATRVEAETERAKRQDRITKLVALTEADIKEVRVPTLADILERDADKIQERQTEAEGAGKELQRLEEQASASVAQALADLDRHAATLKAEAAKQFGVEKAQEKLDAAVRAFHELIHFDELEGEALEKLDEDHHLDCWPDSDCRGGCTFEPDSEDVEEYLLENAEEFELEENIAGTDTATKTGP